MSGQRGLARGRYRFAEWTLTAMASTTARYVGKCLSCGGRSTDTAAADDAQVWCLRHAGVTGHTAFEASAFQCFNAAMTDPTSGGMQTEQ